MTQEEYESLDTAAKEAVDECRDGKGNICPYAGIRGCEYGCGCWLKETS